MIWPVEGTTHVTHKTSSAHLIQPWRAPHCKKQHSAATVSSSHRRFNFLQWKSHQFVQYLHPNVNLQEIYSSSSSKAASICYGFHQLRSICISHTEINQAQIVHTEPRKKKSKPTATTYIDRQTRRGEGT